MPATSSAQIEQNIEIFVENFRKGMYSQQLSAESQSSGDTVIGGTTVKSRCSSSDTSEGAAPSEVSDCKYDTCSSEWHCDSSSFASSSGDYWETSETDDLIMDENGCNLSICDVSDLLQARYAFISGGKARNGSPIITFPDVQNFCNISEADYQKLVTYLTSVCTVQDADLGFVLVIDRRNDKWSAVRAALLKISMFFPGLIQLVFVVRPAGFFQKAISEVGYKFVKDEYKFRVIMCTSIEELQDYVDRDQLTEDLGGYIIYNHNVWIEHRSAIEKFSANTQIISHSLRELANKLTETELPNDVESTEALLLAQGNQRDDIKDDLTSAMRHGETLLKCLRRPLSQGDGRGSYPDKLTNIAALDRLLVQLEETERVFDSFWQKHELKLQQCLQLRKFEQEFRVLSGQLVKAEAGLTTMTDTGVSVMCCDELLTDLKKLEANVKETLQKAEKLESGGEYLIQNDHYAVDSIRPKCAELRCMRHSLERHLERRFEMLQKSRDLHERIEKANKWCTRGIDLLATQQLERCHTADACEVGIRQLEEFMNSAYDIRLNNPKEFHTVFENIVTSETKALVQQVLKRIEDVQVMLEKRKRSLKKVVERPTRAVQPVMPEPAAAAPVHEPRGRQGATPADGEVKRRWHGKKSRNHPKMQIEVVRRSAGSDDSGFVPEAESENSSTTSETDSLHAKRGLVMRELFETERAYVAELKSIIEGYVQQMENPEWQDLIPVSLIGKAETLFGNLEELYQFHNDVFLKDLEQCVSNPSLVGQCFVARKEDFHDRYSVYCQNKLYSETLRRKCGDNNAFFKECQKRLGHRLPLGAYLLKPVQRITKYQLLLKEMLRYTDNEDGNCDIQEALHAMLGVLKYVNDIMHQAAITGFCGNLSELGRLLMQASFNIWTEHKKDRISALRFKPMLRHMFLYENAILFCKKREGLRDAQKSGYCFKHAMEMSEIGLTENFKGDKGDKSKFEVWTHNRAEVYTIQADTAEIKEVWVTEIKNLLLRQFNAIKGEAAMQHVQKKAEGATLHSSSSIGQKLSDSGHRQANHRLLTKAKTWGHLQRPANPFLTLGVGNMAASEAPTMPAFLNEDETEEDEGWSTDDHSGNSDEPEPQCLSNRSSQGESLPLYVALADYMAIDFGELSMTEGEMVEVVKLSEDGWWFVRSLAGQSGWAPGSYLEPVNKRHSRTSTGSSIDSGGDSLLKLCPGAAANVGVAGQRTSL
ncbi:PREDICTED: guanine nucleotide exchange factor DBS-like isoform X2 [Priapulus caudatus]|uniref:Guanine nucleotide exchange factor DBS-like isoform X2 n=1 Tax=Priapulus caudatus TaxID=37621 RepID=A0ABM1FAA7_PRICU|nr:PREDICTED: guanine nucleotide exchange factor DBS-like isoform X2 [Priapulus caudatus]